MTSDAFGQTEQAGAPRLSISCGIPLAEEPGLGALTLPGFLREVTQTYAAREALVFRHPDGAVERWSYGELWDRALAVARALIALGVGKDSRVGVMMTNRPEWIAAFFGIGLAGGVAVTISTFSTAFELEHLLRASNVSVLLFEGQVLKKDFAAVLTELEPQIGQVRPGELASLQFPFLRRLAVLGGDAGGAIESWSAFLAHGQDVSGALAEMRAASTAPADVAAIFFSSGSTGKPKGILSAHRTIAIQSWRWKRIFGLGDDVRCWSANGFFFSGNFAMALGGTLAAGGSLVLQPTFEPAEALRLMQAEKVTFPRAWPHQWAHLKALPEWDDADLSSFHYVDPSYTAPQKSVATTWADPIWMYGNTEAFTIVTAFPCGSPVEVTGDSHGEPLPGCAVKIVEPLTGATAPLGARGELAIKGPTLMLGYVGVPLEETLDAEGFFHTGDGGWIDELGRLHWEGRLNDIIKTGGANVSPLEVDAVLATCPGVKLNMTVGVPDELLGELVVSCVVPKGDAQLQEEAIRAFVKTRLASYKVPRRVLFVREDELSLTGSAKIRSSALRELVAKRLKPGGLA
jgi:acyl-CoA synthetase (AMP-forming)/AMP-acid ligase II